MSKVQAAIGKAKDVLTGKQAREGFGRAVETAKFRKMQDSPEAKKYVGKMLKQDIAHGAKGAAKTVATYGGAAAAGVGAKKALKTKESSVDISFLSNEELLSISDELAPEVVKMAAPMGMLAQGVGRLMSGAIKAPTMARAGIGMAAGAGAGAVRHMMSGTNPQTGQKNTSLLGSMAGGAAMGGAMGMASRQAALRIGTMNNGVGQYTRNAMGARGAAMTAAGQAAGAGVSRSANAMNLIAQRNAAGRMATGGMRPGAVPAAA